MINKIKILFGFYIASFVISACCGDTFIYHALIEEIQTEFDETNNTFIFLFVGEFDDAVKEGLYVSKSNWGSLNAISCLDRNDVYFSNSVDSLNIQCSKDIAGIQAGQSINDLFAINFITSGLHRSVEYEIQIETIGRARLITNIDTTESYDFYFDLAMDNGVVIKDTLRNIFLGTN